MTSDIIARCLAAENALHVARAFYHRSIPSPNAAALLARVERLYAEHQALEAEYRETLAAD
jgi:hypothetical protein